MSKKISEGNRQAKGREERVSRRAAAGTILAFGAAGLSGCSIESDGAAEPDIATREEALSGADIKWVDTVLGAVPPGTRTGDLATKTSVVLGATMVVAKGCVAPGDGGGGVFFWDPGTGPQNRDNGGTIIVPNGVIGSVGPCWRRINE